MAYKEMLKAPAIGINPKNSYEYEVSLASVATSDWILIPKDVSKVAVTLSVAGGGEGKVQSSTDSINTVKTGSPIAIDWDYGVVTVNTQDVCDPPTALRLNQTHAGTSKLTLRAQ